MAMLKGKAYWAKIVGKPVKGYNAGEFEWTMDVTVDKETIAKIVAEGWAHKIKNKYDERGEFVQFKRRSINKDGTPAKPIHIVDNKRELWDDKTLIGNGSVVNVKYMVNAPTEGGPSKFPRVSLVSVQVWQHVPYEGANREDFPTVEDATGTEW